MKDPELREVADGVYAYLQHGGWGYSNAGLITDSGASLLVDTLYANVCWRPCGAPRLQGASTRW